MHPAKDIHCVAFIDSERYCTTAQDGRIRVWNILDQREAYSCHGHAGPVYAVLSDPEHQVVISAGKDGAIYRFAMRNGENFGQLAAGNDSIVDIQLDPIAKILAFARGGQIGWTSADRAGEPRSIQAHARGVTGIALSENAQQLFSIGADGSLRCWDVASGRCLLGAC